MFQVCIDTGGTFTDGILIDDNGRISITKVATTPENLEAGIMGCLQSLAETLPEMTFEQFLGSVSTLTLSTTVAVNALIQLKGARVCMVTTRGFRDILGWRRMMIKPNIYDLKLPKPVVLVPRHLRFVVAERIGADGEVVLPLDEGEVRLAAARCRDHKAEAVAVCFLHSYLKPEHEQRAGEILREELPGVEIILSSDILPRPQEFERFSTTVLAAYVGPICADFLERLDRELGQRGFSGSLLLLTGNGAVTNIDNAIKRPISLLQSGPSAGPVLSTFLGRNAGFRDIISTDMGGTSFEISVIPNGEILTTTDSIICDQRDATDVVDIVSIGAGGGSIARLDERGMLCVGPQSAGADPGPACYGRGGQAPTVTDADVVLGYIPADYFLGGKMQIYPELAEKAIGEHIGVPLGMEVTEAAYGVWSLLITKAAHEIFLATTFRGYDPRHFTLCVGGGAGPTHVYGLAQKLGIENIYIPKVASTFCAFGITCVDFRYEFMKYRRFLSQDVNLSEVNRIYKEMEASGISFLEKDAVPKEAIEVVSGADIQYFGQFNSIETSLPPAGPGGSLTMEDFKLLVRDFHERHQRQRGYFNDTLPTEVVGMTLKVIGRRAPLKLAQQPSVGEDAAPALKRRRPVYFPERGMTPTDCYDGDKLQNGNTIVGPAIIEESTTTIVIPPRQRITVDRYGNYVGKVVN
ncbi:hydantoinase/oxoprolinase family protein [Chloroflexota bacterium]